ncbi:PucR family transcriptional regulator [Amycolatopsis saalfeldensis]|uniref:PucR C-terminal helix-turn-helix domain-containing protein n=1 Tax=Amycolatopsis saalfeldensis TaxID=394193 RepID=A0A1H8XTT2_9PSEU|nr:helix-turn-helix domain-containing protein [Amycolatopsis saalfeldensis]SEP43256.1 PucR C-terminal helix-turn-helix domain-containing protein [Amycolatopsis saalfeldensis]
MRLSDQPKVSAVPEVVAGTSLRHVLATLGEPLVRVLVAPRGLAVPVEDVVILDPEDPPEAHPGDLVLVIGARGRAAGAAIRAAGRGGAAAVAVKGEGGTEIAADAGVALLTVGAEARWEQVEALARGVVDAARAGGEAQSGEVLGDLFALAQTVATLTGGLVSIEDTASRVLAYSRSSDEVDELRRLSILGREGPERYLAMLREWGVYQRLRAGEGIVRIDERPELGIRRRIAAGIHAGAQPLGTIWVQEGATPLTEQAEVALLGASRSLAPQLIRARTQPSPELRLREDLLAGLLDGRVDAESVAGEIGADPGRPAQVLAFALSSPGAAASGRQLRRAELVHLIAVHTAAYRRTALVSVLGGRVYALLPDLPEHPDAAVLALAREIVATARRHLDVPVRAALGGVVPRLSDAAASRGDADRVLATMARGRWPEPVASLADVRADVLLSEVLAYLADQPRIRDPRLAELVAHDAEHGGILVPAVLAYLDAFGDVRAAAQALNIHPNTVRYRVRRAAEVSGISLADPAQRLLTELQLRL